MIKFVCIHSIAINQVACHPPLGGKGVELAEDVLFKLTLAEAYAESARNWRQALQEIADDAKPQAAIYVAEDETHTVVGLGMGGPARSVSTLDRLFGNQYARPSFLRAFVWAHCG